MLPKQVTVWKRWRTSTGVHAVDLLISDFAMPGMNGLMLIHEARRRRPELPALLLTGYADAGVRLALEDAKTGSTALLRKPVSGAELAERVVALLAQAGQTGQEGRDREEGSISRATACSGGADQAG